jgi:alcohol dehydrogenase/L-iditol 2-dehydrogenase
MAKLSGAGKVTVAGLPADRQRLEIALGFGADDVATGPLPEGFAVDVAIDAAGVSATMKTALECIRPAGEIIKVGWGPQPLGFSLDLLVQKNVTLHGSFSHNWPVWERVISMLVSGQIDVTPIISKVCDLGHWHECFEKMHSGEYVKAVLRT